MKIYNIGRDTVENWGPDEIIFIDFRLETQNDIQRIEYLFKVMILAAYGHALSFPEKKPYQRHIRSVLTYCHTTGEMRYRKKIKSNVTPIL